VHQLNQYITGLIGSALCRPNCEITHFPLKEPPKRIKTAVCVACKTAVLRQLKNVIELTTSYIIKLTTSSFPYSKEAQNG